MPVLKALRARIELSTKDLGASLLPPPPPHGLSNPGPACPWGLAKSRCAYLVPASLLPGLWPAIWRFRAEAGGTLGLSTRGLWRLPLPSGPLLVPPKALAATSQLEGSSSYTCQSTEVAGCSKQRLTNDGDQGEAESNAGWTNGRGGFCLFFIFIISIFLFFFLYFFYLFSRGLCRYHTLHCTASHRIALHYITWHDISMGEQLDGIIGWLIDDGESSLSSID